MEASYSLTKHTEKRKYYFKNVEKMNQNGLTATTIDNQSNTSKTTGSYYNYSTSATSLNLTGSDNEGGRNVTQYSSW